MVETQNPFLFYLKMGPACLTSFHRLEAEVIRGRADLAARGVAERHQVSIELELHPGQFIPSDSER